MFIILLFQHIKISPLSLFYRLKYSSNMVRFCYLNPPPSPSPSPSQSTPFQGVATRLSFVTPAGPPRVLYRCISKLIRPISVRRGAPI